jgi:hypothetical protein
MVRLSLHAPIAAAQILGNSGNSSPGTVIDAVRPGNDRNPQKSTCPAIDQCFNEPGYYRFFWPNPAHSLFSVL